MIDPQKLLRMRREKQIPAADIFESGFVNVAFDEPYRRGDGQLLGSAK